LIDWPAAPKSSSFNYRNLSNTGRSRPIFRNLADDFPTGINPALPDREQTTKILNHQKPP
jgi:hypothetical protein